MLVGPLQGRFQICRIPLFLDLGAAPVLQRVPVDRPAVGQLVEMVGVACWSRLWCRVVPWVPRSLSPLLQGPLTPCPDFPAGPLCLSMCVSMMLVVSMKMGRLLVCRDLARLVKISFD